MKYFTPYRSRKSRAWTNKLFCSGTAHQHTTYEVIDGSRRRQEGGAIHLRSEPVVLLGGDGHPYFLPTTVVKHPQLPAALHELIAVVVGEEALPVARRSQQGLQYARDRGNQARGGGLSPSEKPIRLESEGIPRSHSWPPDAARLRVFP